LLIAVLSLVSAAPLLAGGQATITVSELPRSIRATQPVNVTFTVVDVANQPLNDLKPVVIASQGDKTVKVKASRVKVEGGYLAAVKFPAAGEWTLTVDSNYCHNTHVMHGVQVVAAK
jgi:hypothetical protein